MFKVLNDIQLTKNFKLSEFECHDGTHEVMLDGELLSKLQRLREVIGKPMTIAAAYRNPKHNAAVGGSPNSQHMYGKAVDVKVSGVDPLDVARKAHSVGFNGIGVYRHNGQLFTHLDVRAKPSFWHDNPRTKNLTAVSELSKIPSK